MKKLIVNAIPLANVNTGISRYLRCLYGELEKRYSQELEIHYFDGVRASRNMPEGPQNLKQWTILADLFWKLPPSIAILIRFCVQKKRERAFRKAAQGFDLYHEAGFFPFIPPRGVKTVFTIHDMSIQRYPEHHPRERVLFMEKFLLERVALVQRFLTVSQFSKKEIIDVLKLDPELITVIPLAPKNSFSPQTGESFRIRLKQKHNLPSRYFLFVGSGDPRKNIKIIPRALELANMSIPLVCVGWSGWASKEANTNIISLGYLPDKDLIDIYSGAVALVFPSLYEGFGLPVAEAQACGCPVITTHKASLDEVGGDAALYLEQPENISELARLLQKVADNSNLQQDLSRKGLEQAKQFSWAKTADLTFSIFMQAVNEVDPQ